jgi:outer membrane protein assembly factor BamB
MLITRRTRVWALLSLMLTGAACSGGGGGDDAEPLSWGRLRSGVTNAAFAGGSLAENQGVTTTVLELGEGKQHTGIDGLPVTVGGLTGSTPVIGVDDRIYLGTTAGLLVIAKDTMAVRLFDECTFQGETVPVGSVSGTAAININNDVVFGDDNGRVFAFNDDGTLFECLWVFPAPRQTPIPGGVVSSPLILSDALDGSLTTVFLGIGSGHLQAINNFGTGQWRFPTGGESFPGPLTSSVSLDGVSLHVTAPDGYLYSLDRAGRLQHQALISLPTETSLLASPTSGTSTYAVGRGGRCGDSTVGCLASNECSMAACGALGDVGVLTALNPLDEVRWRFAADAPIAGSIAFAIQAVDEPVPPVNTPTPSTTPPPFDPSTPTPTPTRLLVVLEGIVYVVDTDGTVYGVKDESGQLLEVRATATSTPTFLPDQDTPTPGPTPTPPDIAPKAARADLADPIVVTVSPVLSSDLFVVFGTTGGELYAVRLDFDRTIPCEDCEVAEREWLPVDLVDDNEGGGKVPLRAGEPAVSSPIIDRDGTIYITTGDVTTGEGTLHSVGSPPDSP